MTVSLKWFSLNFDFLKLRWKDIVIFYQRDKKPYHTCLLFLYYCFLCISKWEQTIFYLNLIFVIKNIVWIKSLCFCNLFYVTEVSSYEMIYINIQLWFTHSVERRLNLLIIVCQGVEFIDENVIIVSLLTKTLSFMLSNQIKVIILLLLSNYPTIN